jgi:hypothetical protein
MTAAMNRSITAGADAVCGYALPKAGITAGPAESRGMP